MIGLMTGAVTSAVVKGERRAAIPQPTPSLLPLSNPFNLVPKPVVIAIPSPSPSPTAKPAPKNAAKKPAAQTPVKKRSFSWGVTIRPFPFANDNDKFLVEQFRLAKELGLTAIRVDYSVNNIPADEKIIQLAKENNLELTFIIPPGPNSIWDDKDLNNTAYNYAKEIVSRHVGQVPVWQLGTEMASVAIVDGAHHGADPVDYPEAKYQAVATFLKAAARGVRDADPNAKRMINDQWIHVGFFTRYLKEGGDSTFERLGWNWFSDMGTNMEKVLIDSRTGKTYPLMDKLRAMKKEIVISEVNRRMGSKDGNEKAQADFIQTIAEYAYKTNDIKGLYVYNLVEDQGAPPQEQGYSLVHIDKERQWVGGLKEAYNRYQTLIKAKQ